MIPIQMRYYKNYFWLKCSPLDFEIPLQAGFVWNDRYRLYQTDDPVIADKLRRYADEPSLRVLDHRMIALKSALYQSRAVDAPQVFLPAPADLDYYPFQKAGIAFALNRPNVLIADEMGLGKTIQAIGVINADPRMASILVICPAVVKINWQRELSKWLIRPLSVGVVYSPEPWPDTEVVVINYDILGKYIDVIRQRRWDMLVCDEAHYLKNDRAQRTQYVVGDHKSRTPPLRAARKIFLTGTPLLNRPIEGWPIFHYLAPRAFPRFWDYAAMFCDARQGPWGWDMSGNSNEEALRRKLRSTIMIRRLKQEVLTELPPKIRQVIELPQTPTLLRLFKKERDAWQKKLSIDPDKNRIEFCNVVFQLLESGAAGFADISRIRHEQALAKVPTVVQFIRHSLETASKIVVFAYHRDVIAELSQGLMKKSVGNDTITGQTPLKTRQLYIDRFQNSRGPRVLIANFKAAGVGIDLTAAHLVLLAEIDWTPANINQAEDRCHRIGQKADVLVQYLVAGFIDARMARMLIEKQQVLDAVLN